MSDKAEAFDIDFVVSEYCRILALCDVATTPEAIDEYDGIAKKLRTKWTTWNGDDELHEVTCDGFEA